MNKETGNHTETYSDTIDRLRAEKEMLLRVCKMVVRSEIDGSYIAASQWFEKMKKAIKRCEGK